LFAFTFSDPNGHADIHSARVLIHQQLQGANSCYLYYTKADNRLYLHNDAASALTFLTPGSGGTIQNSQCAVNGAASSVTAAGNNVTLNLSMTFTSGYAGAKNIFVYIQDLSALNSGWRTLGTWTVPGGGASPVPPEAVSAAPSSGSGLSQTFAFTFSDPNGHADIYSARVLIHPQVQGANSCYLYYTRTDNKLYLHDDAGSTLTAPVTPGSAGTIQNSQCAVNGAASSVLATGNTLTLNLSVAFTTGFAGAKNIFGYAQDLGGLISGWRTLGTWTVPGGGASPAPPQAISVTPSSGSGSSQLFSFIFSDPNGHTDIHSVRVVIHPQLQAVNSCYLYYTKADNKLYLINDAATALTAGLTPGSAGTIQNSQCAINGATSSVAASGDTLTLNLLITFASGFTGPKTIFPYVQDVSGLVSGWQILGTWTVQ
jgi:hypothetical protein